MAFHLTRVSRRSRRLHPLWSLWPVKQPNMNKVSQEGDEIPSQTCQTTKYEGGMHALPRYLSLQQCQTCLKRRKLYVPLFEPKRKLKCPSDIILIGNSRSPIATKHHVRFSCARSIFVLRWLPAKTSPSLLSGSPSKLVCRPCK